MAPASLLEVGYVARAHGLKGELGVRTFDPASTVFDEVDRVVLHPRGGGPARTLTVESVRVTPKEVLICFEEISGRVDAEACVGGKVLVHREDLEAPEEGEFFQGDLVGLTAVDESGAVLGKVEELWQTGPVPNLVIRAEGKDELVVPFADEFVPTVDLAAGRIVVRPPELLE